MWLHVPWEQGWLPSWEGCGGAVELKAPCTHREGGQSAHTPAPPAPLPTTFARAEAVKCSIQVIYTYTSVTFRGRGIPLPLLSNIPACR